MDRSTRRPRFSGEGGRIQHRPRDRRRASLARGTSTSDAASTHERGPRTAALAALDSWEGVDQGLFDALRQLRRDEAIARSVPAYIVFGDATLRDMARQRPSTVVRLLDVHGVGQKKAADFGQQFVGCIVSYCGQHEIETDVPPQVAAPLSSTAPSAPSASAVQAFPLFDEGLNVEQVAQRLGRALSTTYGYLDSYIRHRRVTDAARWIPSGELAEIESAVQSAGRGRLRPIHEALGGRIGYERIRIAMACLANQETDVELGRPPRRDGVGTSAG